MEGRADSIIQEAIMTGWWKDMTDNVDFKFLSLEPEAEKRIDEDFGSDSSPSRGRRLRGIDKDLRTVSFETGSSSSARTCATTSRAARHDSG